VQAVELGPVAARDQTQTPFGLFLIFAGANIVATTLQVGASLAADFTPARAMTVMVGGAIGGAALVAALAPLGPKLGVPSIVASRAALGLRGAGALATLLFVTNFAWIALNNVIAASITARLTGAESTMPVWAAGLGLVATAIVAGGPRLVGLADRVAVPALGISAVVMTIACLRAGLPEAAPAEISAMRWLSGFDVTAGYQVTWLLMFADYSRYNRSGRSAAMAVFMGLALTAAWFMPLGYAAARIAGSDDPGRMIDSLGLGWWGGVLIVLATLTTNFVNIYMSALALKSLRPRTSDQSGVWLIGLVGAALSIVSTTWLNRFADFTVLLAGLLVPIGGILLAHYFVLRRAVSVPDLYDAAGPYGVRGGWSAAGTVAWLAGAATFYLATSIGGTLPSLAVAIVTYVGMTKVTTGDDG
jgi:NCS1 family nucleobase:cation symporter-1